MHYLVNKQVKIIKAYLVDIAFIMLIFVFCLWNLGSLNEIRVVDEFGYWGVAAVLSGWDWKEILATSQYYSFGYSFVLVPLFFLAKLGLSMAIIYKISIVMNAFFLIGIYFLVQYIEKELFVQFPKLLRCVTALVSTLYIGNTVHMNIAWAEVYLRFIFWCIVAVLISVLKKPNYGNTFLLLVLSFNIFAIHMRAIGVVASVGFILLTYIVTHLTKLSKKYIIFVLGTVMVLILAFWGIKSYVTNTIYFNSYAASIVNEADTANSISMSSINDLQSNINNAKGMLNSAGLLDLLLSACGKMYYAFSASLLLGAVGFVIALVQLFGYCLNKLRKLSIEKWDLKHWYSLFALLAFMGEVLVSATFKRVPFYSNGLLLYLYPPETIVFGRYVDFVVGGIILLGIYGIYNIKQYYKEIFVAVFFFFILAIVIQHQFDILSVNIGNHDIAFFRSNQTPWFAFLTDVFVCKSIDYYSYYVAVASSGFLLLIIVAELIRLKNVNVLALLLTVISIAWGVLGIYYSDEFNMSKDYRKKHISAVTNIIEVTDDDVPIYWMAESYAKPDTYIEILQWVLGDRSIRVRKIDDLAKSNLEQSIIVCLTENENINNVLQMQAENIYNSGVLNVYLEEKNVYYDLMKEKAQEIIAQEGK